jgi:hypothetical protein
VSPSCRYLLCFAVAFIAAAQQTIPDGNQAALLEGTVVNALTKEPVRKAQVALELSEGAHNSEMVATTDETGHFRFADVKAGRYELKAEKSGFLDGSYGQTKADEEGSLVKVGNGDHVQDLKILLFPGGVISGRVLDADGDPVSGDEIVLWTRSRKLAKYGERA